MKNTLNGLKSGSEIAEPISKYEERSIEIIKSKEIEGK